MLDNILENADSYVMILLAVLGVASAIARVTPNSSDNKVMDMIWKFINKLGLRGGPTE